MRDQEILGLYEAYQAVHSNVNEETEQLDEGEGSYGQTPKATAAYAALARSRSGRGSGKKLASKHAERSQKIAPGRSGKRSTSPRFTSGDREKMTQSDRDYLRGRSEYGHVDYDPDYDGQASGPGGKPKGKKLERQRKTGVSAESYDIYDIILSHLLEEGYAETPEAAEKIMVNMSEEWRESVVDEAYDPKGQNKLIKKMSSLAKPDPDSTVKQNQRRRERSDKMYDKHYTSYVRPKSMPGGIGGPEWKSRKNKEKREG